MASRIKQMFQRSILLNYFTWKEGFRKRSGAWPVRARHAALITCHLRGGYTVICWLASQNVYHSHLRQQPEFTIRLSFTFLQNVYPDPQSIAFLPSSPPPCLSPSPSPSLPLSHPHALKLSFSPLKLMNTRNHTLNNYTIGLCGSVSFLVQKQKLEEMSNNSKTSVSIPKEGDTRKKAHIVLKLFGNGPRLYGHQWWWALYTNILLGWIKK